MPDDPPFPSDAPPPPRRRTLTPEQRRFLGTPRPRGEESELAPAETPREPAMRRPERSEPRPSEVAEPREEEPEQQPTEGEKRSTGGMLRPDQKAGRVPELQRAIVALGVLVLLGLTFFVGMKFPYWRYLYLTSKNAPKMEAAQADKFPGIQPEELVARALQAEREGKFRDAIERLIAARNKNPGYRGILAHVGKIAYEQKDYTTADKFYGYAISFGENLGDANYFRGLIAVRRKDLPAALRFFEAASAVDPFVAIYPYSYAEALRLDHHPRDAVARYEQARLLSKSDGERIVCRFKIRMALLEAADAAQVRELLDLEKKDGGKLSVDWLLTEAAIEVREGRIDGALPLISLARDGGNPALFNSCITDAFFVEAAQKHPRLAVACRVPPL